MTNLDGECGQLHADSALANKMKYLKNTVESNSFGWYDELKKKKGEKEPNRSLVMWQQTDGWRNHLVT